MLGAYTAEHAKTPKGLYYVLLSFHVDHSNIRWIFDEKCLLHRTYGLDKLVTKYNLLITEILEIWSQITVTINVEINQVICNTK